MTANCRISDLGVLQRSTFSRANDNAQDIVQRERLLLFTTAYLGEERKLGTSILRDGKNLGNFQHKSRISFAEFILTPYVEA